MSDSPLYTASEAVDPVRKAVKQGLPVRVDDTYVDGVDLSGGWVTFTPVSPEVPPTPLYPYDPVHVEIG